MDEHSKQPFYKVLGRDSDDTLKAVALEKIRKVSLTSVEDVHSTRSSNSNLLQSPTASTPTVQQDSSTKQARFSTTLEEKLLEFKKQHQKQSEQPSLILPESEEKLSATDTMSTIPEDEEEIHIVKADNDQNTQDDILVHESKPITTTEIEEQRKETRTESSSLKHDEDKQEKRKEETNLAVPKLSTSKLLSLAKKDYGTTQSGQQTPLQEKSAIKPSASESKKNSELREIAFERKGVSIDESQIISVETFHGKLDLPNTGKKTITESSTIHETKFSSLIEMSPSILDKKYKYVSSADFDQTSTMTNDDSLEKKLRFGEEDDATRSKGMRFEYGQCPKTCERFLNIEDYAKIFIDDITEMAMPREKSLREQSAVRVVEGIEYTVERSDESSIRSIGTYVCVFEWPTIDEFSIEFGITKIDEFLSYWKFDEDWKYCINYLQGNSDAACDFYQYEAIFSIPCKQYPIPQATASVYFTFEISRIRPVHCLVDVYYSFEGQRSIHKPGSFTFQEEQLFKIVDAKIKFYKTLTF